jgi:ribosomal protein S18 acetylase RimI-like enzyme
LFRAAFHAHIQEIWGWDESWQRSNFEEEFASAETSVIEDGGRIIGYFQILNEDDRIYLLDLVISAELQGRGIGSGVIKALQQLASARNVPLQLAVFRTNPQAQRLYKRLGFVQVGETEVHVKMCWNSPS